MSRASLRLIDSPEPRQHWGRERFFDGDAPSQACAERKDLTGLNRILVFGPFVTLPAGRWRAQIEFELCQDGATRPFRIDFGSQDEFSQTPFRALGPGHQSAVVECALTRSAAVEVRLWLLRPTFHGELRFIGATVEELEDTC